MRRIEIDDEVYQALAERAVGFQQPNDVLRTVLDLGESGPAVTATTTAARRGRLSPLLAAGVIKAGDGLVHVQTRKGVTYVGQVEDDGFITTEHGRYEAPSPALRDLVGTQIDGWAYWTHQSSGKNLRQLRSDAGGQPRVRRQ